MFSKAMEDRGVSRTQRTSFRLSLRATPAARVMRESAMPQATLERVETEQGTITMASKALEPEAKGEARSSLEKTFFTCGAISSNVFPVSWARTDFPHREQ